MEGCTAPVAQLFLCNDCTQQGQQSRLGYAWYASCSICGQVFPHPPCVGFMPPHLGTQAREPEQCAKGTPSLPLTLSPDDLECRAPHHPFDPHPRLCANGGPLPLGRSLGPHMASPPLDVPPFCTLHLGTLASPPSHAQAWVWRDSGLTCPTLTVPL